MTFGAIVVVIAGLLWAVQRRRRNRSAALSAVAKKLGFAWVPQEGAALHEALRDFGLILKGGGPGALRNLMHGARDGVRVHCFDYAYDSEATGDPQTEQTVVCVTVPGMRLPAFRLSREATWDKVVATATYGHIDFPENQVFSQQYSLSGEDVARVRELFTEQALDFFTQRRSSAAEGAGERILFFRPGEVAPPHDIGSLVEECLALAEVLHPRAASRATAGGA